VDGRVFRPVNRADQVGDEVLSEKVVWQLITPYAEAAGVPGIAPDQRLKAPPRVTIRGLHAAAIGPEHFRSIM
jgi:hypothetical protein